MDYDLLELNLNGPNGGRISLKLKLSRTVGRTIVIGRGFTVGPTWVHSVPEDLIRGLCAYPSSMPTPRPTLIVIVLVVVLGLDERVVANLLLGWRAP